MTFRLAYDRSETNRVSVRLFGFKINMQRRRKEDHVVKTTKPKKRRSKSRNAWNGLIHGIRKSFRLDVLKMDVDTGDYVLNAELTPVAMLCSNRTIDIRFNFVGLNYIYVRARLQVYNMVWAFLKFNFKT